MTGRPPCPGSTHVIPVPHGMTPDQAWDETSTLGRLAVKPDPHRVTWVAYECPGAEECRCRFVDLAPNFRRYYNDRLVEARLFGMRVPGRLLPLVGMFSGRP